MNQWVYNISFGYSKESLDKLFFNNAQFECSSDKLNIIIGRNGVGKSTLFNILQGKISEANYIQGSLFINGIEKNLSTSGTLKFLNSKVQLVSQDFKSMLALDFTVQENIEQASIEKIPFFIFSYKSLRYYDLLKNIEIQSNQIVKNLSGGQQQLLSIVMSLQKDPQILLLDEPTSALDDENSFLLIHFLKQLCSDYNIIIIIILHDTELIKQYKDDLKINRIHIGLNQERVIQKIEI